jgi:hypothetical protein
MLHLVYAVLGVISQSWDGEIESDHSALCPGMMVVWWRRNKEMGQKDENDMEDTSGYVRSGE